MAYTTINKSSLHFNTKLYTGDGQTSNAQTGIGFQPDLVWTKGRSDAYDNTLTDAVRGATKYLISNSTNAEATGNIVTSFDSDGFTLGNRGEANNNNSTYVAWNWKANGQGSANSDGTITTTYTSANTTAGISIIKYTGNSTSGATIGHGLGAVPKVFLCKKTNSAGDSWRMYTEMTGNESQLALDQTAAADSGNTAMWNSTTPTSSVITLGNHTGVNGNTDTFIGYAFAEKKGFSKFGKYTGNNNADGVFVYTGFKPAFVLFKRTSATENWSLYDDKRLGYNPQSYGLRPNISNAESQYGSTDSVDFLSNGFKIRESGTNINNGTYIFMAFAAAPLVGTNNIPATAR